MDITISFVTDRKDIDIFIIQDEINITMSETFKIDIVKN